MQALFPRVIMFDLDGTLVDTMPAFADLAAEVMERRHGLDRCWARARYLETSGIPFCKQLEVICPGHPDNRPASDEFEARKRAVCNRVSMDAGTVAALEDLRAMGIRLVVSSNTGQAFVDEFAAREAFRFDLALGFDPARGLAKGRPHVERATSELGVCNGDLLFVGDSLADAELADKSGVAFVGRLGTFQAEDFRRRDPRARTIGHVRELPGLLAAYRDAA
ncbi:MAG TPA: HAD family hydrolase [Kofleriaceae bacterium]|nr:HAD family hydrolase [Kofleriaceae bacterium]